MEEIFRIPRLYMVNILPDLYTDAFGAGAHAERAAQLDIRYISVFLRKPGKCLNNILGAPHMAGTSNAYQNLHNVLLNPPIVTSSIITLHRLRRNLGKCLFLFMISTQAFHL